MESQTYFDPEERVPMIRPLDGLRKPIKRRLMSESRAKWGYVMLEEYEEGLRTGKYQYIEYRPSVAPEQSAMNLADEVIKSKGRNPELAMKLAYAVQVEMNSIAPANRNERVAVIGTSPDEIISKLQRVDEAIIPDEVDLYDDDEASSRLGGDMRIEISAQLQPLAEDLTDEIIPEADVDLRDESSANVEFASTALAPGGKPLPTEESKPKAKTKKSSRNKNKKK